MTIMFLYVTCPLILSVQWIQNWFFKTNVLGFAMKHKVNNLILQNGTMLSLNELEQPLNAREAEDLFLP